VHSVKPYSDLGQHHRQTVDHGTIMERCLEGVNEPN